MACATLKRGQDFNIQSSVARKRRKFGSCAQSYTESIPTHNSPFSPNVPITEVQLKRRIKDEIKRLQRRRLIPKFLGSIQSTTQPTFQTDLRVEDNAAVASCSGSLRSMALRSPLSEGQDSDGDQSPPRSAEPSLQTISNIDSNSPRSHTQPLSHTSSRGSHALDIVPIFTLPQVTALCERLIKEREVQLREEYDNILSCKLAEQYEAFLKFNHDQNYNRFLNAPMSYVS